MQEPTMDPVDHLLDAAFERALAESSVDLVAAVMARIRRRQRLRLFVLGGVGSVAAGIAALGALPLVTRVDVLLAGLSIPQWQPGLPALALLAAACIFGGWLLLEEPA